MIRVTDAWHRETPLFKMSEMVFKVIRWIGTLAVIWVLAEEVHSIELTILFYVLAFLAWGAASIQIACVFMGKPEFERGVWHVLPRVLLGIALSSGITWLLLQAGIRLLRGLVEIKSIVT